MIPFGRWQPDSYNLNSGTAGDVVGVLPGQNAYVSWPQLSVASAALSAACRGAFLARSTTNAAAVFAGDATKLYKFSSPSAWSDFSKVGGYTLAADDLWQFVQFGANIYATQISNPLQTVDVSAGAQFADAPGTPPRARYICVAGDFIILGNTIPMPTGIAWCSRNDPTAWTAGKRDSDTQQFPDGGDVMGLSGFERGGLVFQTDVVRTMQMRTDAAIMEFHRIENSQGTLAPYSIVTRRGLSYYYAINGFQQIGLDGSSEPIGAGWIDRWFIDNSNCGTRPKAIVGTVDPRSQRVFWLFAAPTNSTSPIFNHALCYDPSTVGSDYGPWSHAPLEASLIFPAATTATSLEQLGSAGLGYTMEGPAQVPHSLDDNAWKGGSPRLGAFDAAFKMNFASTTAVAALLQTGLFEPVPGSRAYVNGFRFIGDSPAATGRVYAGERPQSNVLPGVVNAVNGQGIILARSSGKYMRMEVAIPAGVAWTKAAGIDLDEAGMAKPDGRR